MNTMTNNLATDEKPTRPNGQSVVLLSAVGGIYLGGYMEHTPTPKVSNDDFEFTSGDLSECHKEAIVRACNSHDELVAALRAVTKQKGMTGNAEVDNMVWKALAKAEGKN